MDDLDHLLGRAHALEDGLPEALFADAFHKIPDDAEIDIRLEQGKAHLAQARLDILLVELARAEGTEDAGKSVGKALEHAGSPRRKTGSPITGRRWQPAPKNSAGVRARAPGVTKWRPK